MKVNTLGQYLLTGITNESINCHVRLKLELEYSIDFPSSVCSLLTNPFMFNSLNIVVDI